MIKYVLVELFQYESDSFFNKKTSNSVVRYNFFDDPWYYRIDKASKKKIKNYWEKVKDIEDKDGSEGYVKFNENIEEIYDYTLYKECVTLPLIEKQVLESMGFNVILTYYKKMKS